MFPPVDKNLVKAIKKAAKSIVHNGEYGNLYINPVSMELAWEASDGDCYEDQGRTGVDDIKRILGIPGVTKVSVDAEWAPPLKDGFVLLGEGLGAAAKQSW